MPGQSGTVVATNPGRGMVAIATEDNGVTIIELLSEWEIEVGDVIRWPDDTALGAEMYENLTKGTRAQVYVQNHEVAPAYVRRQLLLE